MLLCCFLDQHRGAMQAFAGIAEATREDVYLHPHVRYYVREVRVVAYSQVSTMHVYCPFLPLDAVLFQSDAIVCDIVDVCPYLHLMHVGMAAQFLDSYKSVTLESMASAFGVSVDFIDHELVDFIVAGRLPAKIDKVWSTRYFRGTLCAQCSRMASN